MPPKPWKTLTSREVYKNPWTRVREDIAKMPNGRSTIYGVIECGHCVGVLPFLDEKLEDLRVEPTDFSLYDINTDLFPKDEYRR